MWIHVEGRIFGRYIDWDWWLWYWWPMRTWRKLRYKFDAKYRAQIDDIPF